MDLNGFNTYEYTVDKKCEGALKTKTILLIITYLVATGGMLGIVFGIPLLPLGAVVPIFVWMMIFFTWRYVKVSYSYTVESGAFKLTKIYGNRTKKTLVELRLKDCALIAPLDSNRDNLEAFAPSATYDALKSKRSELPYLILATDKDGKKIAVKIEVTAEALKTFKYYNQNTVITRMPY